MARDSNGNYSLPAGNPVVAGEVISVTVQNATMDDLGTEIADSLCRSGKGAMLADLDMGSNKITALAAPTVDADAATKGFVDDSVATAISQALAIHGGNAMLADLDMGSNKLINLATPSLDTDGATKGYVNAVTTLDDANALTVAANWAINAVHSFRVGRLVTLKVGVHATADDVALTAGTLVEAIRPYHTSVFPVLGAFTDNSSGALTAAIVEIRTGGDIIVIIPGAGFIDTDDIIEFVVTYVAA